METRISSNDHLMGEKLISMIYWFNCMYVYTYQIIELSVYRSTYRTDINTANLYF